MKRLPPLPVSFSQFFLSQDDVLYCYWPHKKEFVAQFVIPERYVPAALNLVHDAVIAGHPGRERTLTAARAVYFWPIMRVDIDAYVAVLSVPNVKVRCLGLRQSWNILPLTDLET